MRLLFTALLIIAFNMVQGSAQQSANADSIKTYYNRALAKRKEGDLSGAVAEFLKARKFAEAGKDTAKLCIIELGLGAIAAQSENNTAFEDAITKAETFCSACKDTSGLARAAFQKGILRLKQQQNDAAIQEFKKAAAFWSSIGDTLGAAGALAKIGNTLELEGNYVESLRYYVEYWESTKNDPESWEYMIANIYLTGSYLNLQQPEKARMHNTIAKSLSQKLKADFEYSNTLRYEATIAAQLNDYKSAYKLLTGYLSYYQDTLMNAESLRQIETLKAEYENEKKEDQIALQKAQLGEERLRLWAAIVVLGLALLAGGFLFALTRRLRKRNEEKEFLIKEIHHRVKNNLQILSSLLHLQSRQITDDTALGAVREGQNRVDAMGLIHQKLYMGDNVAKVEMKDYLEQFGQNMLDSFGLEDDRVQIRYELEPLYLDVDTAIPLGLIINELVTNSLKYAFPENRNGTIAIALWQDEQKRLCLKVSDNGVGEAGAAVLKGSTSFGSNLVQMLSKKLKGKPEVLTQETGYTTFIAFENYH